MPLLKHGVVGFGWLLLVKAVVGSVILRALHGKGVSARLAAISVISGAVSGMVIYTGYETYEALGEIGSLGLGVAFGAGMGSAIVAIRYAWTRLLGR